MIKIPCYRTATVTRTTTLTTTLTPHIRVRDGELDARVLENCTSVHTNRLQVPGSISQCLFLYRCPLFFICDQGVCRNPTPQCGTQTNCGGTCKNTQTNNDNCGGCGQFVIITSCSQGFTCQAGSCERETCDAGGGVQGGFCQGVCVDFQTDNRNCGMCGRDCGDGSSQSVSCRIPGSYSFAADSAKMYEMTVTTVVLVAILARRETLAWNCSALRQRVDYQLSLSHEAFVPVGLKEERYDVFEESYVS
ncbi:hypothetical protein BKA64DRAFT_722481 [Cadophora sp. MPI-SDFR-AT-0126]|nr:hypothetical protein BKA64DRAFT_722481 [Leotiomycetes sp. MPI-SDFR-AT-0126]